MTHHVAIVEDAGPEKAVGVWFPDLPGCFSAGDTIDEALRNAPEAVLAYAEALEADGRPLPPARRLDDLKRDPDFRIEGEGNMVALVDVPEAVRSAAE
jgi:predicted RNase H-like HicB family nuclease